MITRETNDSIYLDLPTLEVGQEYVKVGYLYNVKAGTSVMQSGYYTLYFKDLKGNVVVGRLFNVTDFEHTGLDILALKNKAVEFQFRVDVYNGSPSLIVSKISIYTGMFDYASFIGKVDRIDEKFIWCETTFRKLLDDNSYSLPQEYKTKSIASIYDGRCGGYVKVLEIVLSNIIAYQDVVGVDIYALGRIFRTVHEEYFKYLDKVNELDFVTNSLKFQTINRIRLSNGRTDETIIAEDVLGALIGLNEPESINSVILVDIIKSSLNKLSLASIYNSMIVGASKKVGDVVLLKY